MSGKLPFGRNWLCPALASDRRGFTYLSVLVLVVVSGIALTEASLYWHTLTKREHEAELLFRGDQIRKAIQSYYKQSPSGRSPSYPRKLKDLLKDPRFPGVRRHLRKIYKDPMTIDGKWGLIADAKGGVKGVFSKSDDKPIKTGNFTREYTLFEKSETYKDWKFIYTPKVKKT
jgi:type II secretory pathway pseudopilin PulG